MGGFIGFGGSGGEVGEGARVEGFPAISLVTIVSRRTNSLLFLGSQFTGRKMGWLVCHC